MSLKSASNGVQDASSGRTEVKAHRQNRRVTKRKAAVEAPTPIPARIRIPNELVERILSTEAEKPTLDLLQAHLLLNGQHETKADRIIVTNDESLVDLTRDWLVRMIAESRNEDDGKQIAAMASRVVGFIDNHEGKRNSA